MRRTTIKDVAALAGVSRPLCPDSGRPPGDQRRDQGTGPAACAQLGYVPNAAAKGLTGQAHPHSGGSGAGRVQPLLHGHRHCH